MRHPREKALSVRKATAVAVVSSLILAQASQQAASLVLPTRAHQTFESEEHRLGRVYSSTRCRTSSKRASSTDGDSSFFSPGVLEVHPGILMSQRRIQSCGSRGQGAFQPLCLSREGGVRSQYVAKERGNCAFFTRVLGRVRGGGGSAVVSAGVGASTLSVHSSSSVESLPMMDASNVEVSGKQPAKTKGLGRSLLGISEHDG